MVLIIEDDSKFASILLDLAREKGFKGVIATSGADVLPLVRRFSPDAITLDIGLPDMDGWLVLDQLKDDAALRHIPVTVISVSDESWRGFHAGAFAYLEKPVDRDALSAALTRTKDLIDHPLRRLLVVEDDESHRSSIMALIGEGDALVTAVGTGRAALEAIAAQRFDCLIVDLGLPDMSGVELIEQIRRSDAATHLPIVVYTAQTLEPVEAERLARLADTTVTKGVDAPERLRDETSRFLHRVIDALPADRRRALVRFERSEASLNGRKVLIIDDDVRNIFSLTSELERYGIETCYAENGADGLNRLRDEADVDVALVDIMMPDMDGYETIRAIRALKAFRRLPVIAVTAKAMKGDREKCLAAGASDYVAKPVDVTHLVGVIAALLGRDGSGRPAGNAAVGIVEHAGE